MKIEKSDDNLIPKTIWVDGEEMAADDFHHYCQKRHVNGAHLLQKASIKATSSEPIEPMKSTEENDHE